VDDGGVVQSTPVLEQPRQRTSCILRNLLRTRGTCDGWECLCRQWAPTREAAVGSARCTSDAGVLCLLAGLGNATPAMPRAESVCLLRAAAPLDSLRILRHDLARYASAAGCEVLAAGGCSIDNLAADGAGSIHGLARELRLLCSSIWILGGLVLMHWLRVIGVSVYWSLDASREAGLKLLSVQRLWFFGILYPLPVLFFPEIRDHH
jgi:hypothetical protein